MGGTAGTAGTVVLLAFSLPLSLVGRELGWDVDGLVELSFDVDFDSDFDLDFAFDLDLVRSPVSSEVVRPEARNADLTEIEEKIRAAFLGVSSWVEEGGRFEPLQNDTVSVSQ